MSNKRCNKCYKSYSKFKRRIQKKNNLLYELYS